MKEVLLFQVSVKSPFSVFLGGKYLFSKKNNLPKSQVPFRFSSYCHFVFCTALSMSQSIFSMLLDVSAMPSLAGTGPIMSKIWLFSRIFVKIDQSYFFEKFLMMPSEALEKL